MALSIRQLFLTGIGLTLLVACSDEPEQQAEIIRPVRFELVNSFSSDRSLKLTGITKADEETELSFKVGGTVLRLNAVPGKRIKKGDLIAKLDSSDAELKLDKQVLSLGKAKAQEETAGSNLNRIRGLYENNNVPLSEYEAAKEKFSNATASYETEKRALSLTQRELGYYQLESPTAGIVLSKNVSVNENIQAGQVVTLIQNGDALSVEVGMPEQYIAQVKTGQSAQILLPSITDTPFNGVVTEVAYTVSSESSTYPVTVIISSPTKAIRPGMPANVKFNFQTDNAKSVLVVPVHSVAKDGSGNYVLLVVDSGDGLGKVKKVPVEIGRMTDKGFEITSGINIGDKVITAGVSSLEEGMSVRLLK